MSENELIQWICVGVVFLIVVVWTIRYIYGLATWTRNMKRQGGSVKPPCCGGGARQSKSQSCCKTSPNGVDSDSCDCRKNNFKSGPCIGCGQDCPLSGK